MKLIKLNQCFSRLIKKMNIIRKLVVNKKMMLNRTPLFEPMRLQIIADMLARFGLSKTCVVVVL